MKVLIIGGGAGGIVTSVSIKKLNPEADVTVIGKEKSIFIRCSSPYVLAGIDRISNCKKPDNTITGNGVKLVHDEAVSIDLKSNAVVTKRKRVDYDSLVFATGAVPLMPPIEGKNLQNVFTMRTASDVHKISGALKRSRDVVIIGGGMIGVETAALLSDRFNVTIIEMLPSLLSSAFDNEFSDEIAHSLGKRGVKILLGSAVEKMTGYRDVSSVVVDGERIKADLVLVAAGTMPETKLAAESGIKIGKFGIKTDSHMRTSAMNVYAVGDCAESYCNITGKPMQSVLVINAVSQAKTAAMNIMGKSVDFDGLINPTVTQILGNSLGRVGITEEQAKSEKIKYKIGRSETLNKYDTQPDAKPLKLKMLFDNKERIIGAQVIGSGAIVAGIINLISFAIQKKSDISDLRRMNYACHPELTSPPFSDPVVTACENAK